MRHRKVLLSISMLLLMFTLKPTIAKADHCAGGEVIYEWISDSTYRFFFKFYRDCNGIAEYATQDLCCYNTCTNTSFNVTMQKWNGTIPPYNQPNGTPLTAGCSGYPTRCQQVGSPIPGYQEFWYSCILTLPLQCNYWKFTVSVSARNVSTNVGGGYLYLETTFNNTGSYQGNSSPYFSVKPIPYCCINQAYTYNNGAVDPNNDSLVTEVMAPRTGPNCITTPTNLTYNSASPPYSIPNNPIQTNNSFVTNALTGQLSFTPTMLGNPTLTVRVKEYRNGVQIGSIIRDVQVQILNCSSTIPSVTADPNSIVNGSYVNGQIRGCVRQPLSFCFDLKSADTAAILMGDDNHLFSFPSATITYTNQKTDSVRGCFSWTPSVADTGLKTLIVTSKDSTCRPPGILLYQSFTLPIYIWPTTRGLGDTSVCPKGPAFLGATGGSNFVWTVVPGGSPITSLNCTNCSNPVASPTDTTYYIVTSTSNTYCPDNADTVKVSVIPGPKFDGQNDTVTCPGNPVTLNLKATPPTGVTYSYKWTPKTYLSNDTIMNPLTSAPKDIKYYVTIGSDKSICKSYDTVNVDVLDGFKIDNPDTAICEGAKVQIRGTGDSRYTYTWTTNSPASTFSNNAIINPEISQNVIDTFRYTVKASFAGCPHDSITSIRIEVQPIPTVVVDDDNNICFGDTMHMHGKITPAGYPYTLTWVPGASLDNASKANPIFNANVIGINKLVLTASSSAGCSNSDSVNLTVFPGDFLKITTPDTAICPGDSVQIVLDASSAKSFVWYPQLNMSNKSTANPTVWPTANQTYFVAGRDVNSCTDTASIYISVKPGAVIYLPDSVRLYPGDIYQIEPQGNCLYFTWFPSVGLSSTNIANPIAKPEVNTKYTVIGQTEFGCTTSSTINILAMPDGNVDMPNAFVPGSGPNNLLKPVYLGKAKLKAFRVYNRWGVKVFETADINDGWDGSFNGESQPMGVYIYTIEGYSSGNQSFIKQGNVTLIR